MSAVHLTNVLFDRREKQFKTIPQECFSPLQSRKSVNKSTKNIFRGCFGTDMLFSKLDTFYGPAASYIQFPNTHIPTQQRDFCFSSSFNAMLGAETPELSIVRRPFFRLVYFFNQSSLSTIHFEI